MTLKYDVRQCHTRTALLMWVAVETGVTINAAIVIGVTGVQLVMLHRLARWHAVKYLWYPVMRILFLEILKF